MVKNYVIMDTILKKLTETVKIFVCCYKIYVYKLQ